MSAASSQPGGIGSGAKPATKPWGGGPGPATKPAFAKPAAQKDDVESKRDSTRRPSWRGGSGGTGQPVVAQTRPGNDEPISASPLGQVDAAGMGRWLNMRFSEERDALVCQVELRQQELISEIVQRLSGELNGQAVVSALAPRSDDPVSAIWRPAWGFTSTGTKAPPAASSTCSAPAGKIEQGMAVIVPASDVAPQGFDNIVGSQQHFLADVPHIPTRDGVEDGESFAGMSMHVMKIHPDLDEELNNLVLEDEDKLSSTTSGVTSPHSTWGRFKAFVKGDQFEQISLFLILLNTVLLACQQQYWGINYGYIIGYPHYHRPASEEYPRLLSLLQACETVFLCIFGAEIVVKLIVWRHRWFVTWWNYLDAIVVAMGLISWLLPEFFDAGSQVTFTRLARFGRIFRILAKTRRNSQRFESLTIIMSALAGSTTILFWALMIILLIQCIGGMAIGVFIEPFLTEDIPKDTQFKVFEYYGTWWRSMVTMFEVSLANWAPACRVLFEHVHQSFSYFFLFYRCVIGFAVLSVIQAVFIQQTMKSMQIDSETILRQDTRRKENETKKLRKVFEKLDTDEDGLLCWEEFKPLLNDERMKAAIDILDLDMHDLRQIFDLLSDGDDTISWKELASGLHHIKGTARSLDMVSVLSTVHRLEKKMDSMSWPVRNAPLSSGGNEVTVFQKEPTHGNVPDSPCGGNESTTSHAEEGSNSKRHYQFQEELGPCSLWSPVPAAPAQ